MPRGPGRAIGPQPARKANSLGPKSRAGLKQAWVSGAMTEIRAATVRPMNTGASRAGGAAGVAVVGDGEDHQRQHQRPQQLGEEGGRLGHQRVQSLVGVDRVRTLGVGERAGAGEVLAVAHGGDLAARRAPDDMLLLLPSLQVRVEEDEQRGGGEERPGQLGEDVGQRPDARGSGPRRRRRA